MKLVMLSLSACVAGAMLEGWAAGADVRDRLKQIRMPKFSPPFPVWLLVGLGYYASCFAVLYRSLSLPPSDLRRIAIGLILGVMGLNAFWNYLFFRRLDFRSSFLFSLLYSVVVVITFGVALLTDRTAALSFLPYALYLIYANIWGYSVWQANSNAAPRLNM